MAIFFIFSMMLGAELQITNMFGNTFLHSFDKDPLFASSFIVQHASVMMSISQISETLFILTIPFFLSRYGIKNVMLISIVAWMLRFGLFAYGDPTPFGTVLLVLSMIVYGWRLRLLQHFWLGVCRKRSTPGNPRQRAGDVPDDDQWLRLYPGRPL
ncbi:nucleoside permease [Salmonella enterica subsp. enterica]|uniref:Nucleoside permease n=1 Tax=Salmonella enterica I TaxID=59201 RepID=A0A3S4LS50_SALET|nr:nucleoside permease [Salmonella enterica subsp. enterica]